MEVVWKKIDGFNYEVSNTGKVRSLNKRTTWQNSHELKPGLSKGYYHVTLCRDGRTYISRVHKLVCATFHGVNTILQVNHKDGNKLNNSSDNLEWVTSSENRKHAIRTGLQRKPAHKKKLDIIQVMTIRSLSFIKPVTERSVAKYFGVCQQTINDIRHRKRWGAKKFKLTITRQ